MSSFSTMERLKIMKNNLCKQKSPKSIVENDFHITKTSTISSLLSVRLPLASPPKDVTDNKQRSEDCMNYRNAQPTTLTNVQQDPILSREDARLATFGGWTIPFIDKHKMAMFGFYYIGPGDKVKCFFCRVEIGRWVPEDNVLTEHTRWSPYCALMNRKQTNNVPINSELLDSLLPAPSFDVCGHGVRIRQASYAEGSDISPQHQSHPVSLAYEGIDDTSLVSSLSSSPGSDDSANLNCPKRPEHPEFALESQRLKSYEDWPKTIKQKPEQLSDAGFYYTGKGDRVCCFSCGGGLKDWEENDLPWEQHAMWYSKCEYLKLMKGTEYITEILKRKNEPTPSSSSQPHKTSHSHSGSQDSGFGPHDDDISSPQSSGSLSATSTLTRQNSSDDESKKQAAESRLCKICYETEYNTAFFPCGHVVACGKCASSVTKCPCCRQSFTNVMRVYFS